MIDEYFNKLNTTIASTSMTDEERSRVRGALVAEMAKAPLGRFDALIETTAWYFSTMNYRRIVAAATASAVLFAMGGVSYAAEAALPGDKLYPVKTEFNEAVVEFLAVSDKDKAKVQTEFAQKRLEEASQLAAEGKLDKDRKDVVTKKLKKHVDKVKEELDDIVEREDFVAAVEVATEFEATVRAHTDVLVALVEQPAPVEPAPDAADSDDAADDDQTGVAVDVDAGADGSIASAPVEDVALMAAFVAEDSSAARSADAGMDNADAGADASASATAQAKLAADIAAEAPLALVAGVVSEVADVVAQISVVRAQAQTAVSDSMLVSKRNLAEEKRDEVRAVVEDVEQVLMSTSTLVIEVAASASSTLISIHAGLAAGDLALREERYDDAFRTYNETLLAARELDEKVSALADLPRQVVVTTPVVIIPEQTEPTPVVPAEPVVPNPIVPAVPVLDVAATTTASSTMDVSVPTASTTATTTPAAASSTVSIQTNVATPVVRGEASLRAGGNTSIGR